MKNSLSTVCLVALVLAAPIALAERADREKPVHIEADKVTVDDIKKIHIFEGRVTMTQGTTTIRGDRVVVTQDPEGFQKGVATGNLAYFRTKRDGQEEYVEGEAERIEHNERTDVTEFFNRARVKSGEDVVRGQYIQYDGRTEQYFVTATPQGGAKPGTPKERVRVVIQPKGKEGATAPQTPAPAEAPALKPSPNLDNP